MLQVYTGPGKGKTTAALGLAFRALGQGKRVLLIRFMKKGRDSGEVKAAQRFRKLEILEAGRRGLVRKGKGTSKDRQLAQKGLDAARRALESKKYDLVILDELNVAVAYNLLYLQEVKKILKDRPRRTEVVVTGRYADPEILEIADLVSEIKELKHYYKKGITARRGIEY